jgi:biofilm PGA synthesis N-glycosyltransferase PgaC
VEWEEKLRFEDGVASTNPARQGSAIGESRYIPVRLKFCLACGLGIAWAAMSVMLAQRWIDDLSEILHPMIAYLVIYGIAVIPGFMNAFLVSSLLLDRRPAFRVAGDALPPITVLIAAYNEEENIAGTVESLARQNYPGELQVIVINDGSRDRTLAVLSGLRYPWLQVIDLKENVGKANALNAGLNCVRTDITLTVDGDSYLYRNALENLIRRYLSDPDNTKAVAGAVLVRNSRTNLVTKVQEWDYFHGIAAVKRLQSLFQGTLVAQGAFSAYDTKVLRDLGGWPHTVGEDIVLTWGI